MTKDEILSAIAQMSVMEVVELVQAMEDKFGVSAAAAVVASPAATTDGGGDNVQEEQTEFTLMLNSFGDKKVNVIKVVRSITGLGLKEAKDLVESAPAAVKESMNKEDAEKSKKELEEAGAQVQIK